MWARPIATLVAGALCYGPGVARGQAPAPPSSPASGAPAPSLTVQPWEGLGDNLVGMFGWPNLLFHGAAVAVTPPLVAWVDEPVQRELQRDDPRADPYGEIIANHGGGALPIVAPLSLYATGTWLMDDAELATAGAAAIQAVVVQFAYVGLLKWLTDRAGPFPDGDPTAERWHGGVLRDSENANDFNFNPFDLKGGLRWPSGHTASNMALVSALYAFYPQEHWLALIGYPLALAIGVGMVEGDYHWTSDIVAGALIGHVTGWVIGKGFRRRFEQRRSAGQRTAAQRQPSLSLWPVLQPQGVGVAGRF